MEGRELHVLFIRSFSRLPSDDMKNIKQFHFLFFFVSNNHFPFSLPVGDLSRRLICYRNGFSSSILYDVVYNVTCPRSPL